MNTKEKITEIIKTAEKNSLVNYELQKDHSLSLNAPEGEKPYLEQKYFDLKKQIASTTVIGQSWAENYFNDDIIESNWIQRHTEILLNHIDEKAAWEDLQLFMKQYFNLLSYEKFIKDLSIDIPAGDPAAWAYCYCILAEIDRGLDLNFAPEGKGKAIKKLAEDNHFNAKTFEIKFNKLRKSKQAGKISIRQIPTIKKAIELLKSNPDGLARAKKYLMLAEAQL